MSTWRLAHRASSKDSDQHVLTCSFVDTVLPSSNTVIAFCWKRDNTAEIKSLFMSAESLQTKTDHNKNWPTWQSLSWSGHVPYDDHILYIFLCLNASNVFGYGDITKCMVNSWTEWPRSWYCIDHSQITKMQNMSNASFSVYHNDPKHLGMLRNSIWYACTVNVLKFRTPKRKNTLNLFALLASEAKGSNKFCKGKQNWQLPLQTFCHFPFRD